jgi:hypothetical protein
LKTMWQFVILSLLAYVTGKMETARTGPPE